MEGVGFAGELAREIGIALPIAEIRSLQRPVSAGGEAAMGQSIRKYVTQRLLEISAAGEVSAFVRRVAPRSILGPVPCGHAEFGVIAISDRPPTRAERLLNNMWP